MATLPQTPPQPISPPPTAAMPQQGQAGAGNDQQFNMSQMGGGGPMAPPSPMEANAGIFDQLRQINMQLQDAQTALETIAGQFPGSAEFIRATMQALDVANKSLIDVLTAVISQAQEQQPMSPRIVG